MEKKNYVSNEVAARIQKGNKCYYGLAKSLNLRVMSRKMKKQLYTSLIRSAILYGSEIWPLRKKDENRLRVFERKVLRKMYGLIKDNTTEE